MADRDIHILYYNPFGIGFIWNNIPTKTKIQLVFRDMNLELEKSELELFRKLVEDTLGNYFKCQNCKNSDHCRNILLITPFIGLSLVVSMKELNALKDLIEGILFNLELEDLLGDLIF
jgi:hypothetical protein